MGVLSQVYGVGMGTESWRRVAIATAVAAVATALAGLVVWRRREDQLGPEGVVDTDERRREGSPDDRGKTGAVAIDVQELRNNDGFEPAVEYLTYIQSRRGTDEHLLFVRNEDLDAIAALEGEDADAFLQRLQHLGVVISTN